MISNSLEEKFENLLTEYSLLSSEHNQLKLRHEKIRRYSLKLRDENIKLKKVISDMKFQIESKAKISETRIHRSLTSLSQSKTGSVDLSQADSIDYLTEFQTKAISTWKTPQPNPDHSVESEPLSSNIFEAFFVIGISSALINLKPQEEILYEYPLNNCISPAMKKVIPGLALHNTQVSELALTGSASKINNLVFGQIPTKRNENCYIFTLISESTIDDIYSILPNSNHEVMYFTCFLIEDISEFEGHEWIAPKCYCLASYIPVFELHYDVLCSILFLKRLYRMDLLQNYDNTPTGELLNVDISSEGIELLNKLSEYSEFENIKEINIKTKSMDCLSYKCSNNWSTIDISWLCIPLFSSIVFQDFCWLLSALAQEKSMIFVSSNLGLLTSCVLAMRAVIRPFKWINLTIPVIPDGLENY